MTGQAPRGSAGEEPVAGAPRRSVLVRLLVALIRGYQVYVSPALPPSCRFYPSCSAYAAEALAVHGVLRGTGLTLWRLLKCAPWHPGGIDPVPPARDVRRRPVQDHHEEQAPC